MEKRKNTEPRPETTIEEAAQKADSSIRRLQSRLKEVGMKGLDPEPFPTSAGEHQNTPALEPQIVQDADAIAMELDSEMQELERQLQEAFAREEAKVRSARALRTIRGKVVDSLAENILWEWGVRDGKAGDLENDLVTRLVHRAMEILTLASKLAQPSLEPSFRRSPESSRTPHAIAQALVGKAFPGRAEKTDSAGAGNG